MTLNKPQGHGNQGCEGGGGDGWRPDGHGHRSGAGFSGEMIKALSQVAAQAQQKVALVDISQDILNKAEKRISESLK